MNKSLRKTHSSHPVRKAFSRSAHRYDELAKIQEHIGAQLLGRVYREKGHTRILDIGMGTGLLTQKIARLFPQAEVIGIDFAEGMVHCAKRRCREYQVVQADAIALPFRKAVFDLIISNLAYQWVRPLAKAFSENSRCLIPGGTFRAALFGRHSLQELFKSFEAAGARGFFLQRLPALADVNRALKASGMHIQNVHSQKVTCYFHDMWQLLLWLKKIGANTLPRRGYLGKKILMKANEYYFQNFKTRPGVAVTFEVIWVEAKK